MSAASRQLARAFEQRLARTLPSADGLSFALQLPEGTTYAFGDGEPVATVIARDARGVSALKTLDVTTIAEAYVAGALDVVGDMQRLLAIREMFRDWHPLTMTWRFLRPLLLGQVRSDARWIAEHYDHDPEFYLLFLDSEHRCYSQAVFASDDEPLERAVRRKLDFALEATGLQPGQRVLDIGGGWGAFTQYAGRKGIRVTSLTISRESEAFIRDLISREQLPCTVLRQHFYGHVPEERYDAIVNMGVTEHLPDYGKTLKKYAELLKPGGKVYLDASAARRKHDLSAFYLRYIFQGNGSLMCLHEYLTEVSRTPFEVEAVYNDRHNYRLTTWHWAENLDRHRETIEQRWGRELYRVFQLYLRGCVDSFSRDVIQAYRVVLGLPAQAGV